MRYRRRAKLDANGGLPKPGQFTRRDAAWLQQLQLMRLGLATGSGFANGAGRGLPSFGSDLVIIEETVDPVTGETIVRGAIDVPNPETGFEGYQSKKRYGKIVVGGVALATVTVMLDRWLRANV